MKYTPEEIAAVRKMNAAHMTTDRIAKRIGRGQKAVQHIMRKNRIAPAYHPRQPPKKMDADLKRRIAVHEAAAIPVVPLPQPPCGCKAFDLDAMTYCGAEPAQGGHFCEAHHAAYTEKSTKRRYTKQAA